VREHVSLVESVVGRIMVTLPHTVDGEDLVACGLLGLVQAVDTFEPGHGVKFNTYATALIRGAAMDELRSQDGVPRSVREKCQRVDRTLAELEAQLGRAPDEEEIAAALRMSVDEYHQLLSDASGVAMVSLETLLSGSEVSGQEATVAPSEEALHDPEGLAERGEIKGALAEAIDALPQRERLVIALYYHEESTLRQIGEALGVSESRVCQIHTQAVLRLRAKLSRQFDELLPANARRALARRQEAAVQQPAWPDPPTFEEMSRVVQERLASPAHDAAVAQLRRYEESWAAIRERGRTALCADDLVGAVDDPSLPRSTHLHEDLYGEGRTE